MRRLRFRLWFALARFFRFFMQFCAKRAMRYDPGVTLMTSLGRSQDIIAALREFVKDQQGRMN